MQKNDANLYHNMMMHLVLTAAMIFAKTEAFVPTGMTNRAIRNEGRLSRLSSGDSSAKDDASFKYVGDMPPLNYFDPLQISTKFNDEGAKYVREAELHHGRVAMASFPTLVVADHLGPGLAVDDLYRTPLLEQFPFWIGITAYESARMGVGWKNPFVEDKFFKLKQDYQPGNVFNLNMDSVSDDILNKELANGRLAMIGTLGYLAQELATGTKPF